LVILLFCVAIFALSVLTVQYAKMFIHISNLLKPQTRADIFGCQSLSTLLFNKQSI